MAKSGNGGSGEASAMQKTDCFFFVHLGKCTYGDKCKYNHPFRSNVPVIEESKTEIWKSDIPCKFYFAGNCKYGSFCRFHHPPSQYNSLGLPMRLGVPECCFYMRNHWCGYGAGCKFHHPELTYFYVEELYGLNASDQSQEFQYAHLG